MGNSAISMAIFNSYVKLPEGNFTWLWKMDENDPAVDDLYMQEVF